MYCTRCGNQVDATDRFCRGCGNKVALDSPNVISSPDLNNKPLDSITNWRKLTRAHEIFSHPEVIARIKRVANLSSSGMSDTDIVNQTTLLNIVPAPKITLGIVKEIALPYYSRIGINKESSIERSVPAEFAEVFVAALCSLASRSQPLRDIKEAENGCVIDAQMPASLWTWKGDFIVTMENIAETTRVGTAIKIPGQAFDWGKCKRATRDFFDDIERYRSYEL